MAAQSTLGKKGAVPGLQTDCSRMQPLHAIAALACCRADGKPGQLHKQAVCGGRTAMARRASKTIDLYIRSTLVMPDRRRRTGYRAGAMSEELRSALEVEVARIASLDDPAQQARTVGDFFAALDVELEHMAALRLQAVAAMRRQGMTYKSISSATGISEPRVAQLAREVRAGGRVKKVT